MIGNATRKVARTATAFASGSFVTGNIFFYSIVKNHGTIEYNSKKDGSFNLPGGIEITGKNEIGVKIGPKSDASSMNEPDIDLLNLFKGEMIDLGHLLWTDFSFLKICLVGTILLYGLSYIIYVKFGLWKYLKNRFKPFCLFIVIFLFQQFLAGITALIFCPLAPSLYQFFS